MPLCEAGTPHPSGVGGCQGVSALNGGNVHTVLYSLYSSSNYDKAFHDETVGYNGYYYAGPGYDEVTGIGSPIVYELISLA